MYAMIIASHLKVAIPCAVEEQKSAPTPLDACGAALPYLQQATADTLNGGNGINQIEYAMTANRSL